MSTSASTSATAAQARATPSPDDGARRTLAWGAGVLAVGLGLVGVGSDDAGVLPVLAGLLLTIYGIHAYGRLGPDEDTGSRRKESAGAVGAARSAAWSDAVRGGLVGLAGVGVNFGTPGTGGVKMVVAYGAILFGGFRLVRAAGALSRLKSAPARAGKGGAGPVEKRRNMDKSAPP